MTVKKTKTTTKPKQEEQDFSFATEFRDALRLKYAEGYSRTNAQQIAWMVLEMALRGDLQAIRLVLEVIGQLDARNEKACSGYLFRELETKNRP